MAKDVRYNALKAYIETGNAKTIKELFAIVPASVVGKDIGLNYSRLSSRIANPEKFTAGELMAISKLIGIDSRNLYHLVASTVEKRRRKP